jgi:hypothetical protein
MSNMVYMKKTLCVLAAFWLTQLAFAQNKELKFNFNEDGSHYLKATFTGQVWIRGTDNNPGTTIGSNVDAYTEDQTVDIGIRRARLQVYGKISDNVFVYTQFGTNNMSYNGDRKQALFFHDLVGEYHVTPRALQLGAGLSSWNGLARYTSLAITSYVGFDGPLYQQSTNDATDQFFRKYSVYAKGKLGKFDYRLNLAKPMTAQKSTVINQGITGNSDFSLKPPKLQVAGYFMYQFLDEESNLLPGLAGSYLGKKKIFNIGVGFQYQADAMWHNNTAGDTVYTDMANYNADVFYDHPMGTKGASLTLYGAYTHFGFGTKYLRNNGVMNPSNGALPGASLNGGGNAFPMYGTGDVFYGQVAYLLPQTLLGEKGGQLQPYADMMYANYDRLNDKMIVWEAGFNWLIEGNRSKISLGYQDRPIFSITDAKETTRKGMIVLAYQIAI